MWTYRSDFEQLSRDLLDGIHQRMMGPSARMDPNFEFLRYLTSHDVRELAYEIPAMKRRITKSPAKDPDEIYKAVYWMLSDKISAYKIVAAMTLLRKRQQEDNYR